MRHLWLGIPVFALLWKSLAFPIRVTDFWWHLKMGEVIATTGSIPRVDLFSFTAAGKPFIAQNWLAELLYYATYKAGGLPLLVFMNALLGLAAFLLIYKLCLDATTRFRVAVLVAVLMVIGNYALLRPQTFSILLFAAYSFVLVRYRSHRNDLLWILPPLMVLWVNLHGAFVLGIGLVAAYLACETCRWVIDPSGQNILRPAELRKLAFVLLLCSVATFVNPEFYKVYDYVRTVVMDGGSQQFVTEWQPPRINQAVGIALFYAPFFAGLLIFAYARIKPDLTEMTLFLGFAIFAMMSIRNSVWFGTVAYPMLARYLPAVDAKALKPLRRFHVVETLSGWIDDTHHSEPVRSRLNAVLASLALLLLVTQSPWVRPNLHKTSLLDKQTPVGAMEFIHQRHLSGNIFHPQIFGDYLIWRLWPEQKSFFDGRVHLFGLDFVRQYGLLLSDSRWEDRLAQWNIRYLLFYKGGDEESLKAIETARNSGRWKHLYEDDISVLFEKESP